MPSIRDIFPDKWLKASHLILPDGRRPILAVVIRGAQVEKLHNPNTGQKEPRLVVEFDGKDKRLICNKTQAEQIAALAKTEDYTQWRGVKLAIQAGTAPNKKDTILILAAQTPTQAQAQPKTQDPGQPKTQDPGQPKTQEEEAQDQDPGYMDQDLDHDPDDDNPFA
jgi:hypothetical protein